jgi:uncharacterized membrane protein YphA (DoxX/SURF4 family)
MRLLFGLLLIVHGVAHLVGFVVPWRLVTATDVPYRTTVLDGWVDVGDIGVRSVGVVWLLLALALVVVGIALLMGIWSYPVAMWVLVASLAVCVVGLPDARIGLVVNIVLLIALIGVNHFG